MSRHSRPLLIERDMALTADDFLRAMPVAALESFHAIGVTGDVTIEKPPPGGAGGAQERTVVAVCGNKRVTFTLSAQKDRHFGSMRLPSMRLRTDFGELSGEEAMKFLACFDAHYRRGGG